MFSTIFRYELRYWFTQASTYIYFFVFSTIAFFAFAGSAGWLDEASSNALKEPLLNSPKGIHDVLMYFNKLFMFLLPAIIGAGIYRDYKQNAHAILYTFPIKKSAYLWAKFWSAFTIVCLIVLGVGTAIFLAEQLPDLNPNKVGTTNLMAYVYAMGIYIIPNLLIFGSIIFAAVVWTRNQYIGFAFIVGIFLLQILLENAWSGHGLALALSDPFGQNTANYLNHFWTIEEQNTLFIPIAPVVIGNRLIWLGIAMVLFSITYKKFSFSQHALSFSGSKTVGKRLVKSNLGSLTKIKLSPIKLSFSFKQDIKNCWALSWQQFRYIVSNKLFIALVSIGLATVLFALAKVTNKGDLNLLPATRILLTVPSFFFTTIIILMTFIYGGMLVHRERQANIFQLVDTCPTPTWVMMLSKLGALLKMQLVLLCVLMIAGISIQLYNGYENLELGLYIFHLFVLQFSLLLIWAFATVFIHTLVPNLYLGLFVLVIGWMGFGSLPKLGIHTRLLRFNAPDQLVYSDLNAYGNTLQAYFTIEAYWFCWVVLTSCLAFLMWRRGMSITLVERLRMVKFTWKPPVKLLMVFATMGMFSFGSIIFMEEQQSLHDQDMDFNKALKSFEQKYGHYQHTKQPKITALTSIIQLYPQEQNMEIEGKYTIVNTSHQAIDTLLVRCGFDEFTSFQLDRNFEQISKHKDFQFYVLKLATSLLPSDSLHLTFQIKNRENTLFERNSNVLSNGTFLKQDFLPRLGYSFGNAAKLPTETTASENNYQSLDVDRMYMETTVSTSDDQVAIAPGYLVKKWTDQGRNYFHYRMDRPTKLAFGVHSGKFALQQDHSDSIPIQMYYHPDHFYTIHWMKAGVQAALRYNQTAFSPYQHQNVSVVEFPHSEGTFATTFANIVTNSEIRFMVKTDEQATTINLPFYVSAHELTHQWWGNQLIPADAKGALMLSESITEYVTLNLYRQQFGTTAAMDFLKRQRLRYLRGRTAEQGEEPPLMLVERKHQYIAYGKGAMAFNTLAHHLGESQVNQLLQGFLLRYQFQAAPYPTSLDLISHLKNEIPDSLQYLIQDWFEEIILADHAIKKVDIEQLDNGKFKLKVLFSFTSINQITRKQSVNRPIQLGFYDVGQHAIVEKWIDSSVNEHIFILDQQPSKLILDPNLLVMDKNIEDNVWEK